MQLLSSQSLHSPENGAASLSPAVSLSRTRSFGQSCGAIFFFSSRRRHTRFDCDWSSDVCSSDLERKRGGVEEPVGTLLLADRRIHEVGQGVVFGRLPQIAELHTVRVVTALDEMTTVVGVRQVRADSQVVEQPVRSLEAGRGAREIVVRPDEYAVLIAVIPRQIKRGPVIPARYRHPIVERVPDPIDLV